MKKILPFILICISIISKSQTPAFEFLSTLGNVRDLAFSAEQDEIYFTMISPYEEISVIAYVKKKDGKWSEAQIASFSGKNKDIEPFLSPDGLRLYFSSDRSLNNSEAKAKDYDIWYVERKSKKENWSAAVNIGSPVNSANNEFYPSLTKSGNLYFTSDANTALSKDDIFFCKWDGKNYSAPVALDKNINSEGYEFNAFISQDEKILIYTAYNRKEGSGSGDLYISFKDETGNWSLAKNLGPEVNSKFMDYCPFLDEKTNTLYFTSKRSTISSQEFKTMKDFLKEENRYENGTSRVYKVGLKNLGPKEK